MNEVKAGQRWLWMNCAVYITRVAKDKSWADIVVFSLGGEQWAKRQPLPMQGAEFVCATWLPR